MHDSTQGRVDRFIDKKRTRGKKEIRGAGRGWQADEQAKKDVAWSVTGSDKSTIT